MKKIILSVLIAASVMTACQEKNTFTLTGRFADHAYDGKILYLKQLDSAYRISEVFDSTKVENGKFLFKNIVKKSPVVFLEIQAEYREAIIAEKGNIEVNFDSVLKPTIKGSPLSDQYQQIQTKVADVVNRKDTTQKIEDIIYNFIKPQIATPVGQFFFLDCLNMLDDSRKKELISLTTPDFKNIGIVQELQKRIEVREATVVGKQFTDVKGFNLAGKEVKLSDYAGKGKVVLVDFWASWCGPCRQAMPDLVATYQKYKNKGLEIVGISLDSNKDAWAKATEDLKISWPQFSNLKGWEEDCAVTYGVNSIPHTMLIDKDGKIIARGLGEDELNIRLEESLGK